MKFAVSALMITGAALAVASCASLGDGHPSDRADPPLYSSLYGGGYEPLYGDDWDGWAGDGLFRFEGGDGHFHGDRRDSHDGEAGRHEGHSR